MSVIINRYGKVSDLFLNGYCACIHSFWVYTELHYAINLIYLLFVALLSPHLHTFLMFFIALFFFHSS